MPNCTATVATPPRRLHAVALRGQLRLPVTLHAKRPSDRVRAVIWRFPNLSPQARLLALLLAEYVGDGFRCWPKQDTLADVLELSARRVRDRIRECEAAGLLVVDRKPRYAVYTFLGAALGPNPADCDRTVPSGHDRTVLSGHDRTVPSGHIRTGTEEPVPEEPVPPRPPRDRGGRPRWSRCGRTHGCQQCGWMTDEPMLPDRATCPRCGGPFLERYA